MPEDAPAPFPRRFVPVPRAARRRDGWTPDRQHAFVAALARLPSVRAAARSVGMSARSAHRLRAAPGAEDFALAWDEALEIGMQHARDRALERALDGVAVPIRYNGMVIGTRVKYDDRLLLGVLRSARVEAEGRLPHQERLAYARACAEADARLGPADWSALDRRHAERAAEDRAAERLAAAGFVDGRPPVRRPPSVRGL